MLLSSVIEYLHNDKNRRSIAGSWDGDFLLLRLRLRSSNPSCGSGSNQNVPATPAPYIPKMIGLLKMDFLLKHSSLKNAFSRHTIPYHTTSFFTPTGHITI